MIKNEKKERIIIVKQTIALASLALIVSCQPLVAVDLSGQL